MPSHDIYRLAAMATAAVLLCLAASTCSAHDAPSGWAYDQLCCDSRDCRQIADKDTPRVTREGFVLADGQFVAKSDPKIRMSGDKYFHRCDGHTFGPVFAPFLRCFYVPGGGV